MRAPEQPKGWPNETAPPFTFTFAASNFIFCIFTIPTVENASFNSKKWISFNVNPAFATAFGTAIEGAVVNHSGACSASAYPLIIAIGFKPNCSAFCLLIKTRAAAPSFIVEELAAVAVPSLEKAPFNSGILSKRTFLYSSSSFMMIGSPLR